MRCHHVHVVPVDVTVVDVQPGVWCPACLLPSGLHARAVITPRRDPTRVMARYTVTWCGDCGTRLDPKGDSERG